MPLLNYEMKKDGPIVVIDDDADDRQFFYKVLSSLVPNEIVLLHDSTKVVEYLLDSSCDPFLIISDISMPKINGFELRDAIIKEPEIMEKKIPFLYFTGAWNEYSFTEACKRPINGFFHKASSLDELTEILSDIIDYWKSTDGPM